MLVLNGLYLYLIYTQIKKKPNVRAIRQFYFGENKLELSDNFNNMHILSYKKILNGKGFTIQDVKDSLYITEKLRNMSK